MIISRNRKQNILLVFMIGAFSVMLALFLMNNPAFVRALAGSTGSDAADRAIDAVLSVIKIICDVGGIFLILGGIIKYAIAHANQQGPDEMKAFQWIVAGIILALLGFVIIDALDLKSLIIDGINNETNPVGN